MREPLAERRQSFGGKGMLRQNLPLILRIVVGLSSRWRNLFYRLLGVHFEGYAWLRRISVPREWSSIRLGRSVALDDGVTLIVTGSNRREKILIGAGTYVNRYSILDASYLVRIGQNCMIGPHCYITDHDHGHERGILVAEQPLKEAEVRIGDNVWIGAGAIILKGVTVGDEAVIAAGAVVTRDVQCGEVVGGVPARALQSGSDAIS
jgi:acetyltransferase-like isoleucine patch superfamily enzyme